MAKLASLPQHVLDTRYLCDLIETITPPERPPTTRQVGEAVIAKVAWDLFEAVQKRWCDCDPDDRCLEGHDEDSAVEDGWFCSYRSIEDQYKMHPVLKQAQLDIEANPSEFSNSIYEEIVERCKLEYSKVLAAHARKRRPLDGLIQTSGSPSPPHPCTPIPPFQELPSEILVEIVLLAQAYDPHAHITLSHVDARLRAIVNSAPLLWSRIDFLYPLTMVHWYLERSADVSLIVTALPPIHPGRPVHGLLNDVKHDENTRLRELLRALRPHRHRIISFGLRFDDLTFEVPGENERPTPAHDFLWDGSMVKLEVLDLELDVWTWDGIRAFPSSRSIKELHLHRSWTMEYLPLFSTSLRSLVITDDDAPFSKIFAALQAASRLTSLTIRDMSLKGIRAKKGAKLNLGQLVSLSLVRVSGSAAEALLKCIVAPNLTTIALHLVSTVRLMPDYPDINRLRLFRVLRPSVRHLDLTSCDARPPFFAAAFRAFPHLTHLRITSSNLSEDHLLPLAVTSSGSETADGIQTAACPNLKHLTVDNEFNDIANTIRLVALSRCNSGFPLESLTLRGVSAGHCLLQTFLRLYSIVAKVQIAEFNQRINIYTNSDDYSISETSSEGDWASGDEEIVAAFRKHML